MCLIMFQLTVLSCRLHVIVLMEKAACRGLFDTEAMKAYCILAPEWVPSFISRGTAYQAGMSALC
jgi:hypothetical protein